MSVNEIVIYLPPNEKAVEQYPLTLVKIHPVIEIAAYNKKAKQANYITAFDTLKGKPISLRIVAVC